MSTIYVYGSLKITNKKKKEEKRDAAMFADERKMATSDGKHVSVTADCSGMTTTISIGNDNNNRNISVDSQPTVICVTTTSDDRIPIVAADRPPKPDNEAVLQLADYIANCRFGSNTSECGSPFKG